jgi:uncharacterized protein YcbX
MSVGVTALHIYPIKGCRGISVARATVVPRGFARDRRWMVVDGDGTFVTQRQLPRLALVHVELDGERLRATAPGLQELTLPLDHDDGPRREVEVWRHRGEAVRHHEGSAWFSEFLSGQHELVYMPDEHRRPVSGVGGAGGDLVSFADAYPFLLVGQASLEELNRRLDAPVGMERFRPNIVVTGAAPFAEDGWSRLTVGAVGFRVAKPCARCVVTTVDPLTATRGPEPLRTLASFRAVDNQVMFGVNLIHEGSGEIAVGDRVMIQ